MRSPSPGDRPKPKYHHHWPLWAFVLIIALLVIMARSAAGGSPSREMVLREGQQDFEENCVACHGKDATGTGELATKLVKSPKDLTRIAKASGGTFPFWPIFEIIAGESSVPGHETHQMPEFAAQMKGEAKKPGYQDPHVRVLQLTHYLESIQK